VPLAASASASSHHADIAPPPLPDPPADPPVAAAAVVTVIVCVWLACAPALSVSVSCTVKLPAARVVTVAVEPVVLPLKAALPLVMLHW